LDRIKIKNIKHIAMAINYCNTLFSPGYILSFSFFLLQVSIYIFPTFELYLFHNLVTSFSVVNIENEKIYTKLTLEVTSKWT